ncbi:DUF397 domain-containing protein [Saccharopolyspora sp. ASAGF58]|uniref:DUF397 domain-containing protein n=1 Tax=Saccharopolyspora sp. ASAGF58 TaxID=2719023 RepID=UPI0014402BB3|nr:DUF397 domain-containing protein [Saccharopolyspora sp. ASAGF58]QIZ33655.1 DUF397 domain-containing protein [Saccharopolyspora sp. ASAGF58]
MEWRKSSFSGGSNGGGGDCVEAAALAISREIATRHAWAMAISREIAALPDGRIAIRNSNTPDTGTILFTRTEISAWIKGSKAGEFDDLT